MSAILIVCFLIILATLLFAIGGGLRWYEARRRRQLVGMLRTVSSNGEEAVHVDLLIDPNQKKAAFESLLDACEVFAAEERLSVMAAGVNTARDGAYLRMLARGFRIDFIGVAMQKPNIAGYNRPGVYVIDDWR